MSADDGFKFPDDFLRRLDSGEVDPDLWGDLGRLTEEQREELAQALIEKMAKRASLN